MSGQSSWATVAFAPATPGTFALYLDPDGKPSSCALVGWLTQQARWRTKFDDPGSWTCKPVSGPTRVVAGVADGPAVEPAQDAPGLRRLND